MPHPLEYVTTGALLQCSQGTVPMPFKTTPRTSKIAGLVAGNALDKVSLLNIPSFVICQKQTQMAGGTPVPCVPAPLLWQDTYPAKVGGADTLLFRSCINCPLGQGKIEFLTSGQLPIPPELSQQIKETKEDADEALKQAELEKNSVGEAGLLEGAIPVWGSGRDLIHSIQTGDKVGMAVNAAFLVWDVASVAAGIFSFGTATVAMAGAKAGVRGLIKAGGKVALGAAKKQMASLALKSAALKNGLKNIRPFLAKIPRICVTACFPAGTPVAVEGGYKNIEELRTGDLVWAWHEETGDLALKPVLQTMRRESDALVELQVGADTVQATPEHPFWANGAWTDAGDLVRGDELLRSDGLTMPVGAVRHRSEQTTTVYNVEVADWHTYLVSWWMFVVHNATICLTKTLKSLKTAGGKVITNSKYRGKLNPIAKGKGFKVPIKKNGYPDFSKYLYKGPGKNTVTIEMTGKYGDDFAEANRLAGHTKTPKGYTWHHTEVVNSNGGKLYNEIELVKTNAHQAARHSGGAQLYRELTGRTGRLGYR
ncbi:MAG TPA: polymorphic toxin-type HINT domain-containing protein [Hymenobacter sp.]|uniref:polymorphic toxin-type HINT domain-containing protein n=1 Tax=Hymenobacter sp. TaxID=1898978 RepID=UPI002D80171A|nr:polymorphic toxin-type HINT domain-containing protein [Hymenobacter sp.]HET9505994.1 polymorphic toxin-type HINT domain-containing protein [Hymenobacter sp.]